MESYTSNKVVYVKHRLPDFLFAMNIGSIKTLEDKAKRIPISAYESTCVVGEVCRFRQNLSFVQFLAKLDMDHM